MIQPIWNAARGRMRVAGLASGSGNTLWKTLELQRTLEATPGGSPFEIVAVFADSPEAKALRTAEEFGIPGLSIDIRAFYADRGAPLKDRAVRAEYDRRILDLLAPFVPDGILLAGYVWATTSVITGSLITWGVHPADLAVEKDGRRAYAGVDGVGSTLAGGESEIRASSYLATDLIDGGPILIVSPGVPVDPCDGLEGKDRVRRYLPSVNDEGRIVGARTTLEIANGAFGLDERGAVFFRGVPAPKGLRFESWRENPPLHERRTECLFSPKSVAVIGASTRPGIGNAVFRNIRSYDFAGKVFPVNRKGEAVDGVKGFRSVLDIPERIDLAMLTVSSEFIPEVAEECGRKGVGAMVALTAGFRETGDEGGAQERALMDIVNRYGMRLMGPNCMGVLNTDPAVRLHANMLQTIPERGGVGFVTQSGAIGAAMLDFASTYGLGFSRIASTGNQPDVTACDLLPLYADDPNTTVILAYLEAIPDAPRFARILKRAASVKPVVVLKSGRTEAGAAAARSHTGSLTGDGRLAGVLLAQSGAIVAETLEEAYLLASALSRMPRVRGNRVGILSNAGGPGTLVADALAMRGFELPLMPARLRERLASRIMPQASTGNPLDLVATATPEHYGEAARTMLESGLYDAILVIVVPPAGIDTGATARGMSDWLVTARDSGIPVLSCFFGPTLGAAGRAVMLENGVPSFTFPEQTASVLHLMRTGGTSTASSTTAARERKRPEPALAERRTLAERRALVDGNRGTFLPQERCMELLAAYDFPTPQSAFVSADGGDRGVLNEFRCPAVAKIDHPEILHKSDVGGVVLDIPDAAALERTVSGLLARFPGARGVLVQEQIGRSAGAIELILGVTRDPVLGHAVLVGYGGVGVEVFKDVQLLHVPFDAQDANASLRRLQCFPLLEGYRGRKGADIPGLLELLAALQRLVLDVPEIAELDVNPLIWDGERFVVADARIRIE
jgi:acyl-CoA synthetase (NDP forming)/folate-dependent phosphoribosylglycinamide formyltransferase PurN